VSVFQPHKTFYAWPYQTFLPALTATPLSCMNRLVCYCNKDNWTAVVLRHNHQISYSDHCHLPDSLEVQEVQELECTLYYHHLHYVSLDPGGQVDLAVQWAQPQVDPFHLCHLSHLLPEIKQYMYNVHISYQHIGDEAKTDIIVQHSTHLLPQHSIFTSILSVLSYYSTNDIQTLQK